MDKDVIILEENFILAPNSPTGRSNKNTLINNAYILKKVLQDKIKCDTILVTNKTNNIQKVTVFWKNK